MQREPAEIEREIELTRVYLADTVDAIAHKVSPKAVADRTLTRVKETVHNLTSGGVETFTTRTTPGAEGTTYEVRRRLRLDRVGIAAGGLAGLVGLAMAVRKLRHRS
ncbi:MAG: hypothetical protein QOE76_2997 [Frankiales bacterium]|jgi:hypothetical protein|nr:hypothetical protein [Frankiales bacterium]MDX6245274.1 hypothetical protein [Frankiales bacterium]